jgi:hypothetical protein
MTVVLKASEIISRMTNIIENRRNYSVIAFNSGIGRFATGILGDGPITLWRKTGSPVSSNEFARVDNVHLDDLLPDGFAQKPAGQPTKPRTSAAMSSAAVSNAK